MDVDGLAPRDCEALTRFDVPVRRYQLVPGYEIWVALRHAWQAQARAHDARRVATECRRRAAALREQAEREVARRD